MGDHSKNLTASTITKTFKFNQAEEPMIFDYINGVYYPNWRVYRKLPPSSLNLEFITHIFYAFAG